MSKILFAKNLEQLNSISEQILKYTSPHKKFAFYGKMGVGKTTLIKSLSLHLGVTDMVSSPTFSLVNEYRGSVEKTIFHFDFNRIETETEAYDIGLEEYLDSGNYCFIEWPDKIDSLLPPSFVLIKIKELEGKREIESNLILD